MTQELAAIASAGVVMPLLMVVVLWGSKRAAGDRGHQPTLVAGPLIAMGPPCRRAVWNAAGGSLRCRTSAPSPAHPSPRPPVAQAL